MGRPRRTYTPDFKVRVVVELITGKKSLSQASREYGIKDTVLSRWRQEFLERAPQVFELPGREDDQSQRVAELERLVGRLALQLDIAKKVFGSSDFLSRHGE
jgi:transposase-like protein